jgi:uncharacterized membrane protein YeaQ/YmgE (transglycosylase-associated protein family)
MELIPLLGAVCTLALGILGLVAPQKVADLVGVDPKGALGLSEIRATYGGILSVWVQRVCGFSSQRFTLRLGRPGY